MAIDPQFDEIPVKLNDALLTSPANKADCAQHIIDKGGLTLPKPRIVRAIELMAEDLFEQLILPASTYRALLERHQAADNTAMLRALRISGQVLVLRYEKELLQGKIDAATAEYEGLTTPQKDGIMGIKEVADAGGERFQQRITQINNRLNAINDRRNFGL